MLNRTDRIPQANEDDELRLLRKWRREFHQHPEIRWTEFWTTARICTILEELGFDLIYGEEDYCGCQRKNYPDQDLIDHAYDSAMKELNDPRIESMKGGFTGVIARMKGNGPGPRMAFRFDIDGLPVEESNEDDHLPAREGFRSVNGNMHACAHDGHLTIGLGLARRISMNRDNLKGEYILVFQPAEEGGLGGELFSENKRLSNSDHFVSLHIGILGERMIVSGITFMASQQFRVDFTGKSAHSALAPETGRNALHAACTAAQNLFGIPRHGDGISRVNIGQFRSDNAVNIISDHASFELQVRGADSGISNSMAEHAERVIRGAAEMHDVSVDIKDEGYYISAPNSPELTELIRSSCRNVGIPEGAIIDELDVLGCEDATYIMKKVQENGGKAAYMCLGSDTKGGHHNAKFDFDEDLLVWGVRILWDLIGTLTADD